MDRELPDQPVSEIARLLAQPPSAVPVLQHSDVWAGGAPARCFGCFAAPLPLESQSARLVLKGSPFWAPLETDGTRAAFVASARKEASLVIEGSQESVIMIRWIYRYKSLATSGSSWTREICVLKSSLRPDSTENCVIGIIQRETQRTAKHSRASTCNSGAALSMETEHTRKKRLLSTSLPQQPVSYESWSLGMHFTHGGPPTEWVAKWTRYEQVDLWLLPPSDRLRAIAKISSAFHSVATFWDANELLQLVTPHGAMFPLTMTSFRSPDLTDAHSLDVAKLLTRELESKLMQRPMMRVQLPRGFLSSHTTSENVHYTHWCGARFYGPLNNGVPHGWAKRKFGSPEVLYAEHEGQYANGLPHGPGSSRIIVANQEVLTYSGDWVMGGFGRRGKLHWPDGSYYEGDVCHKDWFYLVSRITSQVYRVSAVYSLMQPRFERLPPGAPRPNMHYKVGTANSDLHHPFAGLERYLAAIEEFESESPCGSTFTTAPSSPVTGRITEEAIEPLPLEERITALLGEALSDA